MKFLQQLFDFYINTSIHVALAVCSLMKITEVYYEISNDKALTIFIFSATVVGYNFIKQTEGIVKIDTTKLVSVLFFGLMIFYGFQLALPIKLLLIPLSIITFFYSKLRNIPSVKILIVALTWSVITVILPIVNSHKNFDFSEVLFFIQRFFLVVVLILPFDIRDFKTDKKQLQTIPQLIGVERTKKIGFVLLAITMLIEFFITPNSIIKTGFLILFFVLLVFLQRATTQQNKYYASFWVEAIPIFWWVLLEILTKK